MAPPANDNFANRITLSGSSGSWSGTNVDATTEGGEPASWPNDVGGAGIWFEWTCPTSGRYQWDTFSVTDAVDTVLDIFEGATLVGLTLFAGNDDSLFAVPAGAGSGQSCIRTDFVGGTTYMIRLEGYGGDSGPVTLSWGAAVPVPGAPPAPAAGEVQLLDGFTWNGGFVGRYAGRWIVHVPALPTAPGDGNVNEYDFSVARPGGGRAQFYVVSEYLSANPFISGLIFDSADPLWFFDDFGAFSGSTPVNADTYDGAWDGPFDLGFDITIDAANSDPDWWRPPPAPVVTSVTPDPADAGDILTITGEHLSGVTGPIFFNVALGYGGAPASVFTYPTIVSDTEITVEVPVGAITAELQFGNSTGNAFAGIHINSTFGVSGHTPTPAAAAGERVDLVGSGFTDVTDVTWGYPYATPISQAFVVVDDEHLHFTFDNVGSPFLTGYVGVTNPSAVSPSVTLFYSREALGVLQAPHIYELSTFTGAPGDTVDVTSGDGFVRITSVEFVDVLTGDRYDADFTVVDSTTMSFVVPDVPLATDYYIEATNAAGTDTAHYPGGFYVHAPAPTITSFSPAFGAAGTVVTIVGTHLTNVVEVDFNGTPSVDVAVVDDSHLTAVVPVGVTTGPIAVVDPVPQTSTSATDFVIVDPPTITSVGPPFAAAGDTITVEGTNFTYATIVTLHGTSVAFTVVDDTTITFVVPTGAVSGPVAVTNPAGTATSTTDVAVVQAPATVARVRARKDRS